MSRHSGVGPRRWGVALGAAILWLLVVAAPASAHGELVRSDPAANASLTEPPAQLALSFTEPIDPANTTVDVLTPEGAMVPGIGEVSTAASAREITVSLPVLDAGVYVVRYQVLSTLDGHITSGSFAFQVDPSGSAAPPSVAPTSSAAAADLPTALARWLALVGGLTLFGSAFFWRFSAYPAARKDRVALGNLRIWVVFSVAAALCLVALGVFLALASRGLPSADSGFAFDFAAPFGATPFGIAMRVAEAGALAAFVFGAVRLAGILWTARPAGGRDLWQDDDLALLVALGAGLVTLAGFSFAGHAAALGGPIFGVFDLVHLLAVAIWLGSLPGFLALYLGQRRRGQQEQRGLLGGALRRHSRFALLAAPVVALTGVANSSVVLGPARNLVASEYGNLLLGKALLFSVAIGLGAANFFLVRRLALRRVVFIIAAELAVAALAVLTAAGLLTVPAAASRAPRLVTPEVATAHLYGSVGDTSVHAIVSVPAPGNQTYQAALSDAASGAPETDLQAVFMRFVPPPGSGIADQRIELNATDRQGLFETSGAYTPIVGQWSLEVTVRRSGVADLQTTFALPVREPGPPERLPPADTGIGIPAPLAYLWRFIPPSPYEWLPALTLFGFAGLLWLLAPARESAADPRRRARLTIVRGGVVTLGVVVSLVVGSQTLVTAANAGGDALLPTENPIRATEASIAAGERAFQATCATCHGADGTGNGQAAGGLPVRPADLNIHVPFHSDAELFAFATRGISGTPMPGFAEQLSAEDRWNLINYLRSRWPKR